MQEAIYLRPKKAAKKLKAAQGGYQTVYIYGVTGTGKTSLVKDFLGRRAYEYYSGLSVSPQQLMSAEDDKQRIVVIDDLHRLNRPEAQKELYPVLDRLMGQRNVWLILIARCQVPRWLMPLYIRHVFCVIEEKELYLTIEEQGLYFEAWDVHMTEETIELIWRMGEGIPIFVKLVAMEMSRAGYGQRGTVDSDQEGLERRCLEQVARDAWDYLETYVCDQWDEQLQDFLVELAIVDKFDFQMARMITGRADAEQLIIRTMETGNFLLAEAGVYSFRRPLGKTLLRRLRRTKDGDTIKRLYYNAGRCYEQRGQILKALEVYEVCEDKASISRLLIENARRNPSAGHYFELRRFYLNLSEDEIKQSAILIAGMSMLHSILMDKEESERWYQVLKEFEAGQTGSGKKEARSMLVYLDIGLPHRGIVRLTDIIRYAGALIKERMIILPEFSVTSNIPSQMNGGMDFCQWSKHDKELAASMGRGVELVLGRYGKAVVNLGLAESFFEKGRDNYEVASLAERGRIQAEAAGRPEQSFVAVNILAWLSLLGGHAEDAMEMLESFESKAKGTAPHLLPNIRALECRFSLYRGRTKEIQEWEREAPDENTDFCIMERFRYLTKVRIYIYSGRYSQAIGLLHRLLYYAQNMHRTYVEMESHMLLAIALEREGNKAWQEELKQCIVMAEEYHFVRLLSREGSGIWKLLKSGACKWENRTFKRLVMEECERMAAFYPSYLKEQTEHKITLSPNALKVLRLQAEGYSTEKIAEILGITVSTVKYHSHETYKKLGVTSKAAAVNEARNWKLL